MLGDRCNFHKMHILDWVNHCWKKFYQIFFKWVDIFYWWSQLLFYPIHRLANESRLESNPLIDAILFFRISAYPIYHHNRKQSLENTSWKILPFRRFTISTSSQSPSYSKITKLLDLTRLAQPPWMSIHGRHNELSLRFQLLFTRKKNTFNIFKTQLIWYTIFLILNNFHVLCNL